MVAPVRIALLQTAPGSGRRASLESTARLLAEAAAAGATLACLPELFTGPYPCQTQSPAAFAEAEPVPGPTTEWLAARARAHGLAIVGSVFERTLPGLYHNTAVVVTAHEGLVARYRKLHIPQDPGFEEKFYFAPGDLPVTVVEAGGVRVAPLVCWDQWFPEAARLAALAGAELVVYPTAIGRLASEDAAEGARQHAAWQTVQRGHAIANGCFVAAVNRSGHEPGPDGGIHFWGRSFVAGPDGAVVAEAGEAPGLIVADLDREALTAWRHTWPLLRDRRPDAYAPLCRLPAGQGRDR